MKMRFVCALLILLSNPLMAFTYSMTISQTELQQKVAELMPLHKSNFLMKLTLSNPQVDLTPGNNQIGIACQLDALALGKFEGSGITKIVGTLSYLPAQGEFYFKNPKIVFLKIDHVADDHLPQLSEIIQSVAKNLLAVHPIYRLKDEDANEKLAKSVLQSVKVENQNLIVELGIAD